MGHLRWSPGKGRLCRPAAAMALLLTVHSSATFLRGFF